LLIVLTVETNTNANTSVVFDIFSRFVV